MLPVLERYYMGTLPPYRICNPFISFELSHTSAVLHTYKMTCGYLMRNKGFMRSLIPVLGRASVRNGKSPARSAGPSSSLYLYCNWLAEILGQRAASVRMSGIEASDPG